MWGQLRNLGQILQTACLTILLGLVFVAPCSAVTVQQKMMTKAVDENSCSVPTPTTNFLPTDPTMWLWFDVTDTQAGDQARVEWYFPSGTLYRSGSWTPLPSPGSWCFWWGLNIAGSPPATALGNWSVKVFWNGAELFTLRFTVGSASAVTVRNKMLTASVTEGVCNLPTASSTFLTTDSKVWLWFDVDGVQAGNIHTVEWYDPNGRLYFNGTSTPAPSSGYRCYAWWIAIAGFPPSSAPGNWSVKVSWNGRELFTLNFTIATLNSFEPRLTRLLSPGFYIVEATLATGAPTGFWGLEALTSLGRATGGFNLGGGLFPRAANPGFGAFLLTAPQPVTASVNAQLPAGALLTMRFLDSDRRAIGDPIAGLPPLSLTRSLDPGFYIVEVYSSASVPVTYQLGLAADFFSGGVNTGGFLAPNMVGFGAFYVAEPQEVTIKLFGRTTYGSTGAGDLVLTLRDTNRSILQVVGPSALQALGTTSQTISSQGGRIELTGYGSVTFRASAFTSAQPVTVSAFSSDETQDSYKIGTLLYEAGPSAPWDLRINTGRVAPANDVEVRMRIPDAFLNILANSFQPEVFVQIYQDGGEEILDHFEPFDSEFDSLTKTINLILPNWAFTNKRRQDSSFEAILMVGSAPIPGASTPSLHLGTPTYALHCGSFGSPLEGGPDATSPFCQGPLCNRQHSGGDYSQDALGNPLRRGVSEARAVASGRVYCIGKTPPGTSWGNFVIIKHANDQGFSLYAHLDSYNLEKFGALGKAKVDLNSGGNCRELADESRGEVKQGNSLGAVGNTGHVEPGPGGDGTHLHVEYARALEGLLQPHRRKKLDPELCRKPHFLLVLKKAGSGKGTIAAISSAGSATVCGPDCRGTTAAFSVGANVTLKAQEATDSKFERWDGCTPAADSRQCALRLDSDKTVTATFSASTVGVTIDPSNPPPLAPGQTLQFRAAVTGTTNTAVTWSATGGTITSSGFYTAPSTSGTFRVRATSVADPSKFAEATVVVRAQPRPCSTTQVAGADTPETRTIEMGKSSGTFTFTYNTYVQPDRMIVSYEGRVLFDTGCCGCSGSRTLTYSGSSTTITVQVIPNCAGGRGTAWTFRVNCPQ